MNTTQRQDEINRYFKEHLLIRETSVVEREAFAWFDDSRVTIDHVTPDFTKIRKTTKLAVTNVTTKPLYEFTANFEQPVTGVILSWLADALWDAGMPRVDREIGKVLKQVEAIWNNSVRPPIADSLRHDVGLRVTFSSVVPVTPPSPNMDIEKFLVELPSGRPFTFDFSFCSTAHKLGDGEEGEPRHVELDYTFLGLRPTSFLDSDYRAPETWAEVFKGELQEAFLYDRAKDESWPDAPFELTSMCLFNLVTGETVLEMPFETIYVYNCFLATQRNALKQ